MKCANGTMPHLFCSKQEFRSIRMRFSGWKIWLHPKIAAKSMAELEKAQGKGAAELISIREEAERLRAENAQLAESNSALSARNDELTAEVARVRVDMAAETERLRGELADIRAELDDRVETERQIKEFETKLSRFDTLKKQYEQRIARLRDKVKELKNASGEKSPEADEIAVIDMDVRPRARTPQQVTETNPEEDWLQTLG